MTIPNELCTERLLLRAPVETDAEEMFARYAQDAEVTRYLSWRPHRSLDVTRQRLQNVATGWETGADYTWLIRLKSTNELVGSIGGGRKNFRVDIGYCLAQDAWGRGYATEAARAVIEALLREPGIWRISAVCHVDNRASARVLEKAGMRLEGTLRRYYVFPNLSEEPLDVRCYATVRGD